uniref:Uncharacterized protein n=1 Tax=Anguilla anguilla TaxID=7936 RepID=A0A0E9RS40_ANGAN
MNFMNCQTRNFMKNKTTNKLFSGQQVLQQVLPV